MKEKLNAREHATQVIVLVIVLGSWALTACYFAGTLLITLNSPVHSLHFLYRYSVI